MSSFFVSTRSSDIEIVHDWKIYATTAYGISLRRKNTIKQGPGGGEAITKAEIFNKRN